MGHFIPYYHFDNPDTKLTPEWCKKAIDDVYYQKNNVSLLRGKPVQEIEDYSSGNFSMAPFKRMFKSMAKKADATIAPRTEDGSIDNSYRDIMRNDEIGWEPLPLIPIRLNSAISTVQKIPIEVECKAGDALAMKKKKEDIEFLKAKPQLENALQPLANELELGKVNLGTTQHSSKKYSASPLGLDLSDPDQESLFAELIYSLNVETSYEEALQKFYDLKKGYSLKLLEVTDQFKFGVSSKRVFESAITGLPDHEYVFPGDIRTPISRLPDYSDNTHRIWDSEASVLDMFNRFGDEIGDEEDLELIINAEGSGYCACNKMNYQQPGNFGNFKVQLKYIEVKTVDWVGVAEKPKSGFRYFTMDEKKMSRKIWRQNTIGFWWLENTKHFFGIHRLSDSYREKGQESYQNFSTCIYKSQSKSAVELSIAENKKAQIADIKLQHALIMSLPPGRYFDLKYMRGALEGLKEVKDFTTIEKMIVALLERNTFVADTSGFEGRADGQQKPFIELPGGLKMAEIQGYIQTILTADQNIANFTGINDQLTGQSSNPEGLVGLQKLLLNSSINAIYYCNEAITNSYKCEFNLWATIIKRAIDRGGKTKEAIINAIGADDVDLLDGLEESRLHDLTITVEVGQREVERQNYLYKLEELKKRGVIDAGDEFMLSGIRNPKARFRYLAVMEKKWKAEEQARQERQYENQQQLVQQQGENMVQTKQAENQGKIQQIYAKGEVEARIKELSEQLGMTAKSTEALLKRVLQKERNEAQYKKSIDTIKAKKEAESQQPMV